VPALEQDRLMAPDIEAAVDMIEHAGDMTPA